MLRGLAYRVVITTINILFPPLAVMILCGADWDCMVNCVLFVLAVLPSHVHGFYISCVYFHRRHKVKKGRYPGGPKSFIHSRNVLNGGASDAEVEQLWCKENGISSTNSRRSGRGTMSDYGAKPSEMVQRDDGDLGRASANRSRILGRTYEPGAYDQPIDGHAARDGYGAVQQVPSRNAYARGTGYAANTPESSKITRRWR